MIVQSDTDLSKVNFKKFSKPSFNKNGIIIIWYIK